MHRYGANRGKYTSVASPRLELPNKGRVASDAQDAIHYFLQAGGAPLQHRYSESAFNSERRSNSLAARLKALESGREKLRDILSSIRPYMKKGEVLWAHNLDDIESAETLEDVEKAARLGAKMIIAIGKRFGFDPYTGETLETIEKEDPRYRSRPIWAWDK